MSLATVGQLYQDINKLAQMMADKPAEASMVTIFNANLAEAKRAYPHHPLLSALAEAQEQARIGDLLIRTGQLQAILKEEEDRALVERNRRR
jgi:hypothetical protein